MFPSYNMATTMKSSTMENDIVLAAKAGFRHIELRKEKLLNYLQRGGTLTGLKTLLEDNDIKPMCINALADISFHKGQARITVQELCHFLCYAGQFVGCPDLEGVLAELSKIAADYHMRLALEYMGVPKNSVRTYAHAMEIVERTGADNVGLLVDTWHHFAGGSKPEELLGPGSDKIFTVHIGDAPDKAPLTLRRNECIWPGDGSAPIPEMLRNLKKVGYEGIVSVEIFDPGVQAMDPGFCIPLAYERTAQAMKEAGVL